MYHIKDDHRNRVSCDLIYQSLAKLIDQVGIENINIKVLVETAGVGRATFYRSFDTLDDVLGFETDKAVHELTTTIYSELNQKAVFSENDIFLWFFKFWTSRTDLLGTLIKAKRYWLLEGSFYEVFKTRLTFIKDLLNMPQATWHYFIKMRTAMLISVLAEWVESGKNESPDELVDFLMKSFTHIEIRPGQVSLGK